jgi:hypothetical protein
MPKPFASLAPAVPRPRRPCPFPPSARRRLIPHQSGGAETEPLGVVWLRVDADCIQVLRSPVPDRSAWLTRLRLVQDDGSSPLSLFPWNHCPFFLLSPGSEHIRSDSSDLGFDNKP